MTDFSLVTNHHPVTLIAFIMRCEEREDDASPQPASSSSSLSSTLATVMELNCGKAGMEGLDKERVNAVIEEASRGSKFYAAKIRSQERISR